jgi:hypothetical protein
MEGVVGGSLTHASEVLGHENFYKLTPLLLVLLVRKASFASLRIIRRLFVSQRTLKEQVL